MPAPEAQVGDALYRETDQQPPPGFGVKARRGAVILFAAQICRFGAQMAAVVVLARLLPPSAFGLIAMVAALSAVLDLVKELGLSAATIQRPGLTQAQVSALFWINAASGAAIALALMAGAPLVSAFYSEPMLTSVTRWLAVGFIVSGLTTQHWALLRREMRFTTVAAIDVASDFSGLAAAVGLALAGAGYWALVAQRLVPLLVNLIACWIFCRWLPDRPRRAPVGDMVRFGISVASSNLISVFTRSIDQVLIGWMWGPVALGFYERAAKLMLVPLNNINAPLYTVALPTLSRLVDDAPRYRRAVRRMFEILAISTMPGAALIACTGDWVTRLLFGPSWSEAAPLVSCIAGASVCQPTIIALSLIFISQGRSREMLRLTLIDAALCVTSFLAGLPFGALGVAAAFAGCSLLLRLPVALWLTTRRHAFPMSDLVGAIAPALSAAGAVAAVVTVMRHTVLAGRGFSPLASYASVVPVALATTLIVLSLFPESRALLRSLVHTALHSWRGRGLHLVTDIGNSN